MSRACRIVLTREKEANRPWACRLAEAGLKVLDLPLIRYETLPEPVELDPAGYDWILFTSPNGAKSFIEKDLLVEGARFGSLGPGTGAILANSDLSDHLGVSKKDAGEFARAFLDRVTPPARILLPGAEKRLAEPARTLRAGGFDVTELAMYRTLARSKDELPDDPFVPGDVVFLCSPSAVKAFAAAWNVRPACVAIGETTAEACRRVGFAPAVAATPDLEAMVLAAGLDPLPVTTRPEIES